MMGRKEVGRGRIIFRMGIMRMTQGYGEVFGLWRGQCVLAKLTRNIPVVQHTGFIAHCSRSTHTMVNNRALSVKEW
jgi:hypothetical protein